MDAEGDQSAEQPHHQSKGRDTGFEGKFEIAIMGFIINKLRGDGGVANHRERRLERAVSDAGPGVIKDGLIHHPVDCRSPFDVHNIR